MYIQSINQIHKGDMIMKKKLFKRFSTIGLALVMLLTLLTATSCDLLDLDFNIGGFGFGGDSVVELDPEQDKFASEIGGVSETFKGVISERSYSTSEKAAAAYVEEELAGNGVAYVEILSSKKLSSRNIKKLNIPADILEGYDEVHEFEVEYSVEDGADAYLRTSYDDGAYGKLNKTKTIKVYVIKFNMDWKYFVPMPVTGDTVSKSYYDSVFNAEKYKNCTFEVTNEAFAEVYSGGQHVTMDMTMNQIIKHADGKVYLEQHVDMMTDGESYQQSIYAYMETVDGEIVCYVKMGEYEDWYQSDLSTIGFTSLEQLTPFYDQYLDYTYFTKTDFGFALEEENARKYFEQALMGALSGMEGLIDPQQMEIDMYAEYYVSEGVLSGMRVDADVDMTVNQGGSSGTLEETVTTVTKCTDYGTTVIKKPFVE